MAFDAIESVITLPKRFADYIDHVYSKWLSIWFWLLITGV